MDYRFLEEFQRWTAVLSTPSLKWSDDISARPTILNIEF